MMEKKVLLPNLDVIDLPIERLPKLKEGEEGRTLGQAIKDRRAVMEDRDDATKQKQYAKVQIPRYVTVLQRIEKEWGRWKLMVSMSIIPSVRDHRTIARTWR